MFPDELEAAFAACPVAYFAQGMCEPHGPQCALGLDGLKAHAICCRAARKHGGIVAPLDCWHIHEISGYATFGHECVGEVQRSWLTSLPPWVHFRNVCYQVRTADVMGFHAAIFVTGHYGPNWMDLRKLLELVQPHVGTRLHGLPDFEANTPGFDNDGRSGGDHAGKVETSLLWALEPDCVDVSRIPPAGEPGTHLAMGRDVRLSDRRVGERMVDDEVRHLGAKAADMLADYDRLRPAHALRTFEDVERLWETVVRPAMKGFHTMQQHWPGRQRPPEDSVWYANWKVPDLPPQPPPEQG
jgi:creatinine amidohydrolase